MVTRPAVGELESPHRLVRASAGTGKTYRLTVELLGRCLAGSEADSILATTFTRKAAGEILERVLMRLAAAAEGTEEAERLASELAAPGCGPADFGALLGRLCRSLHRLQVSTMDSFFYRLVRSFRLELGVPSGVSLLGNDDARLVGLRAEALDEVLERLDFPLLLALLDRLQEGRAARAVSADLDRLLVELHEIYRHTPDPAVWRRLEVPAADSGESVDEAVRRLDDVSRTSSGALRKALRRSHADALAGRWEDFLARGPAKPVAAGETSFGGRPISPSVRAALEPLVDHARAVVLAAAREQTESTFLLLHHFAERFEALRRRERVLLFEDLPHKLARELPALAPDRLVEVFYRLDARVAHLLVDEFQDTSLEQWRVLLPFVDEILAHADGSRTFFCVGDPKQAIYGWRGGCAELFGRVEELLGDEPAAAEVQRTSYRTAQVVLDVVDRVFAGLEHDPALQDHASTVAEWLASYVALESHEPERSGFVELVTSARTRGASPSQREDDQDGASAHDRAVADLVERLAQQTPRASIGVLVQTNAAVRRLLELLRRRGVEASGEGGVPIVDDPAVRAVLSALLLADHPADSAAAFYVASSPLAPLVGLEGWRPPRAGGGPDAEALAVRAAGAIRQRLAASGVAELLAEWGHALRRSVDERARLRLAQLVELADRWEPHASLRPAELVEQVASAPVEEPSAASVRVMTVHKAKGLEFDVTVLAELDREMLRTRDLLLWVERPTPVSPPRAVHRAVRAPVRSASPALEEAYGQEKRRQLWDGLSGLYVALTRARSALHLVVPPLLRGADGAPRWGSPSWAGIVLRALADDEGTALCEPQRRLFVAGDEGWRGRGEAARQPPPVEPARPWPPRRSAVRAPSLPLVRPSRLGEAAGRLEIGELLRLEGTEGRRRGVLLHAWLRELEWLDDGPPEDDVLERVARRVAPHAPRPWLEERREELARILAMPAVRRVFSHPTQVRGEEVELWRERPFAQVVAGRLIHGVLDRVVVVRRRDAAIGADLLELKTDARAGSGRAGGIEEAAVERYRPQLEAYRGAVAAILGVLPTAVQARLVFLVPGVVREL